MPDLLGRLDRWLKKHRPGFYASLEPGATPGELADFERALGHRLPTAFAEFYRWRNGQAPHASESFVYDRRLLTLAQVRETMSDLSERRDIGDFPLENWWQPLWLPFLESRDGDALCLDLQGTFTGRIGQLLEYWHDDAARPVVFPDFAAWLKLFVTTLDADVWIVPSQIGGRGSGHFMPGDAAGYAAQYAALVPGFPLAFSADPHAE